MTGNDIKVTIKAKIFYGQFTFSYGTKSLGLCKEDTIFSGGLKL